ncbi:MAG: type I secretion system permease/ATPase [Caulobacteraceae bacterium]|nr:type I secretion system permease/ATPase [Caulobacteraceae bacterium]
MAAFEACRRHLVFAGIFSALLNVLYLAPTLYMLQVYDRVVPTRGRTTLLFLTLVLLLSLATLALLDLARSRILVRAGVSLERSLAAAVLDAGFSRSGAGRDVLMSRATRDFDVMRQVLTGPGMLALFDAPWSPIYIVVSLLIHPVLGLVSLVGAAVLFALTWLNEMATRAPLRRANEASNLSYLSQQYSTAAAELIRTLGMRRTMVNRHLRERQVAASLQLKASFAASGLNAGSRFMRLTFQSLALGVGAFLAIEQQISAGAIFAASLLVGRALSPMDQLLAAWRSLAQARDAYRNLKELLPAEAPGAAPTELPPPSGALAVERLSVATPAGRALLSDVSFSLAAGETLGVIGPSGAGKSTLARAIAGAVAADNGVVRLDGADRSLWDQERLARHIGYMSQETTLFAGTVKQNIARFDDVADSEAGEVDARVVAAAQLAGAHAMIMRFANGYDTQLAWGGRGLAAGHAQRIAFARALYGSPALLVLDEPNAHLDGEGEAELMRALAELKQRGVTVVIVAHRTGVLAAADKLMVMREGRIELFGPRDEVVRKLTAAQSGRPMVRQPVAGE